VPRLLDAGSASRRAALPGLPARDAADAGSPDVPGRDLVSLVEITNSGDRLGTLRALRDRIALQIDETESARDVAALAQRLMDVLEQIEHLDPAKRGDEVDEITARRRSRRSTGTTAPGSTGTHKG